MKKNQRYITAGVTLVAAAATAHLMQRGSGEGTRMAALGPAEASIVAVGGNSPVAPSAARTVNPVTVVARPEPAMTAAIEKPLPLVQEASFVVSVPSEEVQMSSGLAFPDMPRLPGEALTPAALPINGPELRARMASVVPEPPQVEETTVPEVKRNEFGLSCGALLTASAREAAMVGLTLTDPCRGKETFTVTHGAMTVSGKLNPLGTYMAEIPALSADAVFTVRFGDGTEVDTQVDVPMADQIDRVALFTTGTTGLSIHALEFGADYDTSGHIWSGHPRNAEKAAKSGGGFVTVLGDVSLPDAQLAEVYTFPANTRHREGVVRLSIETEITSLNCGKDISGQSLQKEAGQMAAPVSLTLAMPDCDAIGEFLVLKNLLRDLKIASN